jgi:hypothetical protein
MSVELKKREMNGYVTCGIISIYVYFFYQKQVPVVQGQWNSRMLPI